MKIWQVIMRRKKKPILNIDISSVRSRFVHKSGLNFRRRRRRFQIQLFKKQGVFLLEIALVLLVAFLISSAFGIRIEVLGNSMEETLNEGNTVLLNKFVYVYSNPDYNDVVAFLPEGNLNAQYSIKRVVGLPGDTIQIQSGYLFVNGERYNEAVSVDYISNSGLAESEITLGENEYFLLGDNRNNSEDSRYETIGNVSKGEIVGKVWFCTSFSNFGFVD
jgi:signal peptidase I